MASAIQKNTVYLHIEMKCGVAFHVDEVSEIDICTSPRIFYIAGVAFDFDDVLEIWYVRSFDEPLPDTGFSCALVKIFEHGDFCPDKYDILLYIKDEYYVEEGEGLRLQRGCV